MKKLLAILIVSACAALPSMAERPVHESVDADARGEVSIELLAGTVRVIGWERDRVEVTGTIGDDVEELTVDRSGDRVEIEVELKHDADEETRIVNNGEVELEIRVPRGSTIALEAISVDFSVEGVEGDLEIEAVSGEFEIRGALRSVDVELVSGEIDVVVDRALREAEFETVSADIAFRGEIAAGADLSFESVSGNVTIFVPRDASAEFAVETFSGKIDNDFGHRPEKESRYAPGQSLEFTVGGGEGSVEVTTFSGRVELRRE